jgi:acyl dehydratase
MTRWFEDIVVDLPFDVGSHTFTEEEIVRFGKRYDPQYFHVDPEAAKHSHFGGLVASGWHTVSVGHRKMVDRLFAEEDIVREEGGTPGVSGPSPGVNRMDFKAPVRPGDTVRYTLTVTGKRMSNSLPGWGLLFNLIEAHTQHGELVYSADLVGFSKLRDYRMQVRLKMMVALSRIK